MKRKKKNIFYNVNINYKQNHKTKESFEYCCCHQFVVHSSGQQYHHIKKSCQAAVYTQK